MFGVMEHYINKWCSIGDARTYDTDEKKADLNENTNRCLDMVNLYCDLSVLRQILLADMASVVAEVGIKGTPEVFMSLIRKEQKSDKKLLTFLIDPTNHRCGLGCHRHGSVEHMKKKFFSFVFFFLFWVRSSHRKCSVRKLFEIS